MNRDTKQNRSGFWLSFGPGLIWAATAIGVSHLVQSTRAGAVAGTALIPVILLALVLKYPFFEAGPRYVAATGESLIEGYRRIGRWAIQIYFALTVLTAVIVQSAVLLFTVVLLQSVLPVDIPMPGLGAGLCAAGGLILWFGRFALLDLAIKFMIALLTVSTLAAAVVALPRIDLTAWSLFPFELGLPAVFLLALLGWMPSGVDTAVWSSLWTQAKDRSTGKRTPLAIALLDYRIGYVGTGVLAVAFVILGAAVMHESGERFSPRGTQFSLQLVNLYVGTLGEWTRPIILVAVLTTMFSTLIAVIDGFPRSIDRAYRVMRSGVRGTEPAADTEAAEGGTGVQSIPNATIGPVYWLSMSAIAFASVLILARFLGTMTGMIDFATILSFLTAPLLGYLNLRAVTGKHVPSECRPGKILVVLGVLGILLLTGIAFIFALSRLGVL